MSIYGFFKTSLSAVSLFFLLASFAQAGVIIESYTATYDDGTSIFMDFDSYEIDSTGWTGAITPIDFSVTPGPSDNMFDVSGIDSSDIVEIFMRFLVAADFSITGKLVAVRFGSTDTTEDRISCGTGGCATFGGSGDAYFDAVAGGGLVLGDPASSVPEPGSAMLLLLGLAGLSASRKMKQS